MDAKQVTEKQRTFVLQSWSKQAGINPLPVEQADGISFYDYDGTVMRICPHSW